jgi:hypothetical protein
MIIEPFSSQQEILVKVKIILIFYVQQRNNLIFVFCDKMYVSGRKTLPPHPKS